MINGKETVTERAVAWEGTSQEGAELLRVEELFVAFRRRNKADKVAVHRISFSVKEGEVLGIAGESGSGKSMTALSVMGLLPEGAKCSCKTIMFDGKKLRGTNGTVSGKERKREQKEQEQLRQQLSGLEMAMIFQEPLTSLNPVLTIRTQMEEPLLLHTSFNKEEREQAMLTALAKAELKNGEQLLQQYPHQLSGGMRQRVMIAMAMLNKPRLLIADEPTTALDAVTEREIVGLIKRLAKENRMSVLFISHDLSVLRELCDRVMIMRDGVVVEEGVTEQIFDHPERNYTKRLMAAAVKGPKETGLQSESDKSENSETKDTVLLADHVSVTYRQRRSLFQKVKIKQAVKQVSFHVQKGEIFGIVGESGCGKSTLLKVLSGLLEVQEGCVTLQGVPVSGKGKKAGVQMVFQDPYTSLNPAKKVGWILEEPLRLNTDLSEEERRECVARMLEETELPEDAGNRFVAELSGGQRQRVAIAAALITNPELVLLDEPVSALDVTVQAQILELLLRLQREHGLTYVFVSHDMAVVRKICDRVMVMKDGKVIECGNTEELFLHPKEEYTKKLLGRK